MPKQYIEPLTVPKMVWGKQEAKLDVVEIVKNHLKVKHGVKSQTILKNMSGQQVLHLAERLMKGQEPSVDTKGKIIPLTMPKINWNKK